MNEKEMVTDVYSTHRAWILVADAAHARLFETHEAGTLSLVRAFQVERANPSRALPFHPHGSLECFARMLAGILAQGRTWGRYEHLAIVAPREVAEAIRARLSQQVLAHVVVVVEGEHAALDALAINDLPEIRAIRPLFELVALPVQRSTVLQPTAT